jgi:hypothetical protein
LRGFTFPAAQAAPAVRGFRHGFRAAARDDASFTAPPAPACRFSLDQLQLERFQDRTGAIPHAQLRRRAHADDKRTARRRAQADPLAGFP